MNSDLKINKGVELMLRRENTEQVNDVPEPRGFKFSQQLSFLRKTFHIKFEFTWEGE